MSIAAALVELKKFSSSILIVRPPADQKVIEEFEEKYHLSLPLDYKTLLINYNGINLFGTEVYGIKVFQSYSLEDCFEFEHYQVKNAMPLYLVPFSPDGGGNHYCFDSRRADSAVFFWQHDFLYDETDRPDLVNKDLSSWIQQVMIEWTLEDYHYDGSER